MFILPVSIFVMDEPSPENDDAFITEAVMLLDPNISPYIPVVPISLSANIS